MENHQNNEAFAYTYSAKEQAELKAIRQKYLPPEQDKMAQLRRLDAGVTNKATILSLVIGVIGALILGIGMCCVLVWQGALFVVGIVVGIIGMAVLGVAYPAYLCVLKKERERVAPEILRLTDELMK